MSKKDTCKFDQNDTFVTHWMLPKLVGCHWACFSPSHSTHLLFLFYPVEPAHSLYLALSLTFISPSIHVTLISFLPLIHPSSLWTAFIHFSFSSSLSPIPSFSGCHHGLLVCNMSRRRWVMERANEESSIHSREEMGEEGPNRQPDRERDRGRHWEGEREKARDRGVSCPTSPVIWKSAFKWLFPIQLN